MLFGENHILLLNWDSTQIYGPDFSLVGKVKHAAMAEDTSGPDPADAVKLFDEHERALWGAFPTFHRNSNDFLFSILLDIPKAAMDAGYDEAHVHKTADW